MTLNSHPTHARGGGYWGKTGHANQRRWRQFVTHMVAAIGRGEVFSKGRDFGAWLGLVPKQTSTGDRTILGKISKRGNRYLRVLFVQAAWVVLIKPKSWERHGLKPWIEGRLDERVESLSGEIEAVARQDADCERLMSVPGIGPIISSAM